MLKLFRPGSGLTRTIFALATVGLAFMAVVGLGAVLSHGNEGDNPTAWVANGAEGTISVIDRVTGEELERLPAGINPHILTGSPDGKFVYVINAGGHDLKQPAATTGNDLAMNSLWVFDAGSGDLVARVGVGRGPTHPIASPDGSRVYVTNTDEGSVTVIDTTSWEVTATVPNLPEPHDGELTPDGSRLYLATSGSSSLTVLDTATLTVVKTLEVGVKPRGVVAGGVNGELAFVSNKGDGTVSIVDVDAEKVITVPIGKGVHALRLSPDGTTLYAALSGENAVAVVDAVTGEVRMRIPVGASPEQLDVSPDGSYLAVSNNKDATLSLIDLNQLRLVRTVPVGQGAYGVQFSNLPFKGN